MSTNKICHQNIRKFQFETLEIVLEELQPHMIILTEHHMNKD